MRPLVKAALERLRNEIDPVRFAAAWERGHALSLDDAFGQVLLY